MFLLKRQGEVVKRHKRSCEQKQCPLNRTEIDQHCERREKVWRRGFICLNHQSSSSSSVVVVSMSCCFSCCASLTCGLCTSTVSCISQKSARIGYCGLFGASLIVSWILREVGAPLLEKFPCIFHSFSKSFNFHLNFPLGVFVFVVTRNLLEIT